MTGKTSARLSIATTLALMSLAGPGIGRALAADKACPPAERADPRDHYLDEKLDAGDWSALQRFGIHEISTPKAGVDSSAAVAGASLLRVAAARPAR